jgi:hypothetical protein
MSAQIVPLRPHFDPSQPGAERHYDRVVSRINRLATLRARTRAQCTELERQFVEDELVSASGRRRGEPLTTRGRKKRLDLLLEKSMAIREHDAEWERLHAQLENMNRALDDWARENWGLGGGE